MDHSKEFLALVEDARQRVHELTVDELEARRARGERLRLVDVREDDEWRAGHAAGAEHLGRGVIERDIVGKIPDKNEPLVLYCGGGFRSALAADNVQRMGYQRVWSLAGGWKEWLKRGLPIEKSHDGK
jgi:rhodanese-related sulfurtransferase